MLGKNLWEIEALPHAEFLSWVAFDRIHPLPDGYANAALICSTVANAMGGGGREWTPEDFYPSTKQPLSPEDSVKLLMRRMQAGFKVEVVE